MGSENLALVKKFSSVFARRIAASARPDSCQSCECIADQNGIDIIECLPCSIPVPAYSDFVSTAKSDNEVVVSFGAPIS